MTHNSLPDWQKIKQQIKDKAIELGAIDLSVASIKIPTTVAIQFTNWLSHDYHGSMSYLAQNLELRFNPELIKPETQTIICIKVPYLSQSPQYHIKRLSNADHAYISSYAVGRDYHKTVKQLLNKLANFINQLLTSYTTIHQYRAFTDSAPVMEVQLASQSGLGWRGKNTLLLDKNHGSMFFLGELFTNLPLPVDNAVSNHCGSCSKCMDICPTKAFVAPYQLDARRCISYLTIENKGSIPEELRPLIGNRVYGCDDCQLFCPWNKFSQLSTNDEFNARHKLDDCTLLELFNWSENEFYKNTEGSAIRRIGYDAWLRNMAIGIGNGRSTLTAIKTLEYKRTSQTSAMVIEHINWAIKQLTNRLIAD